MLLDYWQKHRYKKQKSQSLDFVKRFTFGLLLIEGKFVSLDWRHLLQVFSRWMTKSWSQLFQLVLWLKQLGWESLMCLDAKLLERKKSSLWDIVAYDYVFSVMIADGEGGLCNLNKFNLKKKHCEIVIWSLRNLSSMIFFMPSYMPHGLESQFIKFRTLDLRRRLGLYIFLLFITVREMCAWHGANQL